MSNGALDVRFWCADNNPRSKTHPQKRAGFDLGRAISRKVLSCLYSQDHGPSYSALDDDNSMEMEAVPFMIADDGDAEDPNNSDDRCDDRKGGKKQSKLLSPIPEKGKTRPVLPFRRIWT